MAARQAGKRFVERSNQIIWHRCKGHLLSLSSDFLCRPLSGQKHFPVFLLRPMPRRRFEPHLECFSPILKLSDLKGALGRGWNWPDDFSPLSDSSPGLSYQWRIMVCTVCNKRVLARARQRFVLKQTKKEEEKERTFSLLSNTVCLCSECAVDYKYI